MARRPDTPCSHCGKLLYGARGSLPAGQRTCRDCRRTRLRPPMGVETICPACGNRFMAKACSSYVQRACSRTCARKMVLGATEEERRARRRERLRENYRRKNRRRRAKDIVSEPYTTAEIAARDGSRCGLCHRKVNMKLAYPHPRSASIDHIIPLSISRDDTRVNVQLAHLNCNLAKGARPAGEQLALVG